MTPTEALATALACPSCVEFGRPVDDPDWECVRCADHIGVDDVLAALPAGWHLVDMDATTIAALPAGWALVDMEALVEPVLGWVHDAWDPRCWSDPPTCDHLVKARRLLGLEP